MLTMFDHDDLTAGDDARSVSLSEAAQAVMDVLEETHAELSAVRRRLSDEDLDPELKREEDELPSPTEQAQHAAARLEACAGTLRNASDLDRE